ncbi:MAG: SagB/ThcOx family dehydrogenase [Desulfovibrionales bacterium]
MNGQILTLCIGLVVLGGMMIPLSGPAATGEQHAISLPEPVSDGGCFHEILMNRRSIRSFGTDPLTMDQVSSLLFAAQGENRPQGKRTVPSAGALYPLEVFLVAGHVEGIQAGVYHYAPKDHALTRKISGDMRGSVAQAALGQGWIADAQAVVVIAAVKERVTQKYGSRGTSYVHMEAGAAAQSLGLQVAELGLGSTIVGAFNDQKVSSITGISEEMEPLLLMPVGTVP